MTTTDDERPPEHRPGDLHEYDLVCRVCGQRGQVQISVEPQRVPSAVDPDAPGVAFTAPAQGPDEPRTYRASPAVDPEAIDLRDLPG